MYSIMNCNQSKTDFYFSTKEYCLHTKAQKNLMFFRQTCPTPNTTGHPGKYPTLIGSSKYFKSLKLTNTGELLTI